MSPACCAHLTDHVASFSTCTMPASGKKVFIEGVDILARVDDLEASQRGLQHTVGNMSAMIGQLRTELREAIAGLTTAPSTPPTTSRPSAAPSRTPSTTPSGSPSGSPTITWQISRHAGAESTMEHNGRGFTVYKFTDTANNASVRAFTVGAGSRLAEVLIVGGGGAGGDGNAPGGGGGGGIVVIGNVTLQPGPYFVTVGGGGILTERSDQPGFCGQPSMLRIPGNVQVVGLGGAGGNGYRGASGGGL